MSVTVISLHQHYLLSHFLAFLDSTETKYVSESRISLLVAVSDTHTASSSHIEPFEVAILVDNSNKSNVVGENIDIIGGRNGNGDFELMVLSISEK